jgi:hypothetical protein
MCWADRGSARVSVVPTISRHERWTLREYFGRSGASPHQPDLFAVKSYSRPFAVGLVFLLTAENAYRTVAGRYAEQ